MSFYRFPGGFIYFNKGFITHFLILRQCSKLGSPGDPAQDKNLQIAKTVKYQ